MTGALRRIGILETGAPPAGLEGRFGDYPAMLRGLLGEGAFDYRRYDARAGALPVAADACDGYLVTGSASAAYDKAEWIDALKRFLRSARGRARLVGVCFGHQVMAEAFGGVVRKSERGWAVGVHTYAIREPRPWMGAPAPGLVRLPASHQDQVVTPPADAEVLGSSAFTPYGLLAYADGSAMSLQLHPEFSSDYARALLESRRGGAIDAAVADAALGSFETPHDGAAVGSWIRAFLGG